MMRVPISKTNQTIELELSEEVFPPSIISTVLLYSVDETDIPGKTVIDVGCGSGYVGLGLLARGASFLYGSDISASAISLSCRNMEHNNFGKIACFYVGDMFEPCDESSISLEKLDLVISNPPQTPKALICSDNLTITIDGGGLGDEKVTQVLDHARHYLTSNGIVYVAVLSYSNPHHVKQLASTWYQRVDVGLPVTSYLIVGCSSPCRLLRASLNKGMGILSSTTGIHIGAWRYSDANIPSGNRSRHGPLGQFDLNASSHDLPC